MIGIPVSRTTSTNAVLYGVWGLFWVAMTVVQYQDALQNPYIRWWQPLLWEGSSAAMATLWLVAQRAVDPRYQQYLDRPWIWLLHHLKWFPLIAVTFIPSIYAIRHGIYALLGARYEHESWAFVFSYESVKLVLFAGLWLGIIFGFDSFAQWRSQSERLLGMQKSLAESRLLQLQTQLRPHFLFNALNTISSLIHSDPAHADRLLVRLGDLLRASLQADRRDMTSLREELDLLRMYAQIMEERFVGRVVLRWRIEDDTLGAAVPSLLLQPLLENAFKHGVEKNQEADIIDIASCAQDGRLQLTIRNGGTLSARRADGIGLRNCEERLQLLYGSEGVVTLSQTAGGVELKVLIPYRECSA
jgi:hypothetical protein